MADTKQDHSRPSTAWVPVCDKDGRTRMEARWTFAAPRSMRAA